MTCVGALEKSINIPILWYFDITIHVPWVFLNWDKGKNYIQCAGIRIAQIVCTIKSSNRVNSKTRTKRFAVRGRERETCNLSWPVTCHDSWERESKRNKKQDIKSRTQKAWHKQHGKKVWHKKHDTKSLTQKAFHKSWPKVNHGFVEIRCAKFKKHYM